MKYFFVLEKGEDGNPIIDENETYPAHLEGKVDVETIKKGEAVFSCELDDESFEKTIDGTSSETVKASVLLKIKSTLQEVSLDALVSDIQEQPKDGEEIHALLSDDEKQNDDKVETTAPLLSQGIDNPHDPLEGDDEEQGEEVSLDALASDIQEQPKDGEEIHAPLSDDEKQNDDKVETTVPVPSQNIDNPHNPLESGDEEQGNDGGVINNAVPLQQPEQAQVVGNLMEGNPALLQKKYYFVLPTDASGSIAALEKLSDEEKIEEINVDGYPTSEEAEANLKTLQKNHSALWGIFEGKFPAKNSPQFSTQELQGALLVRLWDDEAVIKHYLHQDKKLESQTIESYVAELNGAIALALDEDAPDVKKFTNEKDLGVIRAVHLLHLLETQKNAKNEAVMLFINFAMTTYNYASFGKGALHKAFLSFVSSYEKYSELTSDNAFEKFYPDIKDAQIKQRYLDLAKSFVEGMAKHGFQWANFETDYNQLNVPKKFDFAETIRDYLSAVHKLNDTVVDAYLWGHEVLIDSNSKTFADESNKGIIRAINLLKLLEGLSQEDKNFVLFSIFVHKYNTFTEGGLRSKLFEAFTADSNSKAQGLKLDTDSVYKHFYPVDSVGLTQKVTLNPFFAAKKQAKESIVDTRKQEYLFLAEILKERLMEHDFDVSLAVEGIKATLMPESSTPQVQPPQNNGM